MEVSRTNLLVCSPLGVAMNSSGKLSLIVDLHYINQHLRSRKFKYEDIRTEADLFQQEWVNLLMLTIVVLLSKVPCEKTHYFVRERWCK